MDKLDKEVEKIFKQHTFHKDEQDSRAYMVDKKGIAKDIKALVRKAEDKGVAKYVMN